LNLSPVPPERGLFLCGILWDRRTSLLFTKKLNQYCFKHIMKYSLSIFRTTFVVAALIIASSLFTGTAHAAGVLGVTQITAVKTFAQADNTYENGWRWVFGAEEGLTLLFLITRRSSR